LDRARHEAAVELSGTLGVHVCAVAAGNHASAIARNAAERFAPPPDTSEALAAL